MKKEQEKELLEILDIYFEFFTPTKIIIYEDCVNVEFAGTDFDFYYYGKDAEKLKRLKQFLDDKGMI